MLDPTAVPGLLGPLGLLIGSLIVVMVLWRLVQDYITDLRTARDRWRDVHTTDFSMLDEQKDAIERLTTAVEKLAEGIERIDRRTESLR
jgi:hypothetical protein